MHLDPIPDEVVLHVRDDEAFERRFGSRVLLAGGSVAKGTGLDITLPLPSAGRLLEDLAAAYAGPRGADVSVTKLSARDHDPVQLGYALNAPRSTRFLIRPTDSTTVQDGLRHALRRHAARLDLGPYLEARARTSADRADGPEQDVPAPGMR
jgi:hypothetical protein